MQDLRGSHAVVTGGSRGLGLGIVRALVASGMEVTVIARDAQRLAGIAGPDIRVRAGDAADPTLLQDVIASVQPRVLVLNAGAVPVMGSFVEQSWETFCTVWENDVKAGFYGMRVALDAPLPPGSRVLVASSGAATVGAPLSGSYAGAKRMLWFLAAYANGIAKDRGLDITFQAVAPLQMIDTQLTRHVAGEYARRAGVSIDAIFARYEKAPLSSSEFGEYVASLLNDPAYAHGVAYGIDSSGITQLEGGSCWKPRRSKS
jgi:NAD(P)-dependent dehydrogenase (short-subunit alcohol dehydrogenase family)